MKSLYSITLIATLYICSFMQAIPNFELISADPTIPIHVQANGGAWQTLDQKHYRFPVEVPENMLLIVSLSANDDKSAPTSLIFAPERALDIAKEVGSTITKAPTFYVAAHIAQQEILGKNITIKRVLLKPQTSPSGNNKTKSGFPLDNNVTQEMIDSIVQASSPDEQDIIKQATTMQAPVQPAEQPVLTDQSSPVEMQESIETIKAIHTQPEIQAQKLATGPLQTTGILQHIDTPQRIEATLKELDTKHQESKAKWQAIRNYMTQTKIPIDTHKDDATLYKEFVEHYQTRANKTKSTLNTTYLNIIEIIKNAYTAAH